MWNYKGRHVLLYAILTLVILVAVVFFNVFFNEKTSGEDHRDFYARVCMLEQELIEQHVEGVVDSVFEDPRNHMYPTIWLVKSNSVTEYTLEFDKSKLFSFLEKGDHLLKHAGSKQFQVKKSGMVDTSYFRIDFGCAK